MRAVALHRDVLVATSALLATTCTIVRGSGDGPADGEDGAAECFVIDSPILPGELEMLSPLVSQAGFPLPSGLLATHGDWDHLLGRLAFPQAPLGCAESTARRLAAEPGVAQRALRDFDRDLYVSRAKPLSLGSVQALAVPGRCDLGPRVLELYATGGHTSDGMAVWIPWAGVLVAGDYLSPLEIPMLSEGGGRREYLATLERLRPLVERAEHVVPGHGSVLDAPGALSLLEEDVRYLEDLGRLGAAAELPPARRTSVQRRVHAENVEAISPSRQGS
jgi:glyoxylase-like metal-dependent hydrolase (beta-lactamase superfamily II)